MPPTLALSGFVTGHPAPPKPYDGDPLLDRFMPTYEIAERRYIFVTAPADTTFAAACDADLMESRVVRAIFRARELVLGSQPDSAEHSRGVVAFTKSIGWSVLTEAPDSEIVMGTVTQPWNPNVVFRPVPPEEFLAFGEPGYVKIAWTLRAHPIGQHHSIFRHETRVMTTDPTARARFRRYWAFFSPGIKLTRWLLLPQVRTKAERRLDARSSAYPTCRRRSSRFAHAGDRRSARSSETRHVNGTVKTRNQS